MLIIPESWINKVNNTAFYPPENWGTRAETAAKQRIPHKKSWRMLKIQSILGVFGEFDYSLLILLFLHHAVLADAKSMFTETFAAAKEMMTDLSDGSPLESDEGEQSLMETVNEVSFYEQPFPTPSRTTPSTIS